MTDLSGVLAHRDGVAICPICDGLVDRSLPAQMSPFIRERCCLPEDVSPCAYFCDVCEHVFMTPLLTAKELERLYSEYRGAEYTAQRIALEPDYAGHAVSFADRGSPHHQIRREFYDAFRSEMNDQRGLVVDDSEGDGYFARYAFPHADVVTLLRAPSTPGVDLERLLPAADTLMCAYALQTDPRPFARLSSRVSLMKPGATVWIEVPTQYQGSLKATFEVLEARAARGTRNYEPLQIFHENQAHFSVRSLRRLMQAAGLVISEIIRSNGMVGVHAYVAACPAFKTSFGSHDQLGIH